MTAIDAHAKCAYYYAEYHYSECCNAEYCYVMPGVIILSIAMLNAIQLMQSILNAKCN